jgi:hypothetical protein
MLKNQLKGIAIGMFAIITASAASGCGAGSNKNPSVAGVDGPTVNYVDNVLTFSMTIQSLSFDQGIRLPVPNMPNSYLEVGPNFQSNGLLISIGLAAADLKALVKVDTLDPTTLPGGRPLPGVVAGELPGVAVTVPKWDNVVFYVGPQVFGIFVPVKIPLAKYIGTFRFYDGAGDQVGNISVVGEDSSGLNSGILLLINLAGKVGSLIGV